MWKKKLTGKMKKKFSEIHEKVCGNRSKRSVQAFGRSNPKSTGLTKTFRCLPRISESKRDTNTRSSHFQQIYVSVIVNWLTKETISGDFIHEIKVQTILRGDLYCAKKNYKSVLTMF